MKALIFMALGLISMASSASSWRVCDGFFKGAQVSEETILPDGRHADPNSGIAAKCPEGRLSELHIPATAVYRLTESGIWVVRNPAEVKAEYSASEMDQDIHRDCTLEMGSKFKLMARADEGRLSASTVEGPTHPGNLSCDSHIGFTIDESEVVRLIRTGGIVTENSSTP